MTTSVPYANATSGDKALGEIQKTLTAFGCSKFGNWSDLDAGTVTIQFEYRERKVSVTASAKGWAAMYLRVNPWNHRRRLDRATYEAQALFQGNIAVFSMLRDWIKGQITAVESGILSFEAAFLGQLLLPDGRTVLEHVDQHELLTGPTES